MTERWKTSRLRICFGKLAEKEGQDYRTKRSRRTRKGRIARTRGERRRVRTRRKRRKTARKRKQAGAATDMREQRIRGEECKGLPEIPQAPKLFSAPIKKVLLVFQEK